MKNKKNKVLKRIIILLSVVVFLVLGSYIAYCLYERYESNYTYKYCEQIWFNGYYQQNLKLKFNYLRMDFKDEYYDYEKSELVKAKYKRKDVAINIKGKFYNIADLTLDRLNELIKQKKIKELYGKTLRYINGKLDTNSVVKTYIVKDKDFIYGSITLEYKNGKVHQIEISAGGKDNKFIPEIKFKNQILKMPTSLQKIEEFMPEIKYYSRSYTSFNERLRRWFFKP
ncbi:hypothetical protein AAEX28_05030 [Lentisphaerota bacterium WC36G]|nr:hypothetical protein LJT99_07885 [Lentisphaerae bacterium WC36]